MTQQNKTSKEKTQSMEEKRLKSEIIKQYDNWFSPPCRKNILANLVLNFVIKPAISQACKEEKKRFLEMIKESRFTNRKDDSESARSWNKLAFYRNQGLDQLKHKLKVKKGKE